MSGSSDKAMMEYLNALLEEEKKPVAEFDHEPVKQLLQKATLTREAPKPASEASPAPRAAPKPASEASPTPRAAPKPASEASPAPRAAPKPASSVAFTRSVKSAR